MGDVVYLPKRYVSDTLNIKRNNSLSKILFGLSGVLIMYGLYRLVRAFDWR